MKQTNELIADMRVWTTLEPRQGSGILYVRGRLEGGQGALVRCRVEREGTTISEERFSPADFQEGVSLRDLQIRYWWPNGAGERPMYTLRVEVLDAGAQVLGTVLQPVGFKHVTWEPLGTCVINDRPIALQMADWTPGERLETYRDQGVNTLRVSSLEEDDFYAECDALGLMVWQEIPPGTDAQRAVERLQAHVSLLLWGGAADLEETVSALDPTRRFNQPE